MPLNGSSILFAIAMMSDADIPKFPPVSIFFFVFVGGAFLPPRPRTVMFRTALVALSFARVKYSYGAASHNVK